MRLLLKLAESGDQTALDPTAELCLKYPRCLQQADPEDKLLSANAKWSEPLLHFMNRLAEEWFDFKILCFSHFYFISV